MTADWQFPPSTLSSVPVENVGLQRSAELQPRAIFSFWCPDWQGCASLTGFRLGTGSESNDSMESPTQNPLRYHYWFFPGCAATVNKHTLLANLWRRHTHTQAAAEQRWTGLLRAMHCGEMSSWQKWSKVWLHFTKKDNTSGIVTCNTCKRDQRR